MRSALIITVALPFGGAFLCSVIVTATTGVFACAGRLPWAARTNRPCHPNLLEIVLQSAQAGSIGQQQFNAEAVVADSCFATGGGHGDHGTIGGQFDHGIWVGRAGLGELVR